MKILTEAEGLDWLRENGLPTDKSKLRFFHNSYIAYEFHNPPLTIPQIMLADGLIQEILQLEGTGVLWIGSTHMGYPSNVDLFKGYRKSLGEARTVEEAPFHLFDVMDMNCLVSLLQMIFHFEWDACLISQDRETIIYIKESWFIDVTCKNPDRYADYRGWFKTLKMREIKPKRKGLLGFLDKMNRSIYNFLVGSKPFK